MHPPPLHIPDLVPRYLVPGVFVPAVPDDGTGKRHCPSLGFPTLSSRIMGIALESVSSLSLYGFAVVGDIVVVF